MSISVSMSVRHRLIPRVDSHVVGGVWVGRSIRSGYSSSLSIGSRSCRSRILAAKASAPKQRSESFPWSVTRSIIFVMDPKRTWTSETSLSGISTE